MASECKGGHDSVGVCTGISVGPASHVPSVVSTNSELALGVSGGVDPALEFDREGLPAANVLNMENISQELTTLEVVGTISEGSEVGVRGGVAESFLRGCRRLRTEFGRDIAAIF